MEDRREGRIEKRIKKKRREGVGSVRAGQGRAGQGRAGQGKGMYRR